VTASPQTLPGTGGTASVSARVEDQQGNGLLGVPVSFSTTKGTLSSTSVVTNDQGVALTSLTTTEDATVTASAGGAVSSLTGTVTVTLSPRTTIQITAPASIVAAVPAAFVFTPGAGAIITELDINWGDGARASIGAVTAATTISHAFRRSGSMVVTAEVTDSSGGVGEQSIPISVAPLPVSLSSFPNSASAPVVGETVTFAVSTTASALIDHYEWDFGDSQTQRTSSGTVQHQYGNTGTKIVSVKVVPLDGGTVVEATVAVTVK
jgi:hypothetical protein